MKKKLLALIDRHNAVVDALSECDLPVPEGKVFRAMEIWHKLACEGYDITHMAREAGSPSTATSRRAPRTPRVSARCAAGRSSIPAS